ncbi:hypothetical protein Vafri_19182 [Volvox africanus]|uniref:Peptidase C1A papain C-terminal domain-containing protein n=1 Tax=Volvox africanus TaxID=51714 RepID=A0A8J4BNY6_9CHLO|nr:hypothetical protein Vafri_19182 [Volvox africanus]
MVRKRTWPCCPDSCGERRNTMMKTFRSLLLLSALAMVSLRTASAAGCQVVAGYDFWPQVEVSNAFRIKNFTVPSNLTILAELCTRNVSRCNAFNTRGVVMIAPLKPFFSFLDGTVTSVCDGVYIANRTLTGLDVKTRTVDYLRATSLTVNMVAAAAAASRVITALKAASVDITPSNIFSQSKAVTTAFQTTKTPLAQVSNDTGNYTFTAVANAILYPIWDSRSANGTRNLISPIKDQGDCGSCVAFATTACAEAAVAAAFNSTTNTNDFSEQWLFFCNGKYTPTCETGWNANDASEALRLYGIPAEANYPYKGKSAPCTPIGPLIKPDGKFNWKQITDLDQAKEHIRLYGSVLTYFAVYNDFYNWGATSPPYVWDGKSALAGYHQVLCIGYNDTGRFWIAKNSWGSTWGDRGFFRMSYTNRAGFMTASGDNVVGLTFTSNVKPPPIFNPPPVRSPSPPPSPPPVKPPPPSPPPVKPPPPSKVPRPPFPRPPSPAPFPPAPRPPPPSPPPPRPPPPSPPKPACGDKMCNGNETCASCPGDCGACSVCGDGVCSGGETCRSCFKDCFKISYGVKTCCGDNICSPGDNETCSTCPLDCGVCPTCNNNGICESVRYNETCYNTVTKKGCLDCGTCGAATCGDGICTFSTYSYSESCTGCSKDCGKCTDYFYCGDGYCDYIIGETATTCSRDCLKPRKQPPSAPLPTFDYDTPPPPPPPPEYFPYDYGDYDLNYYSRRR